MADTTNIEAPKWTASQNSPDVTINSALDVIDSTMAAQNVIDFPSDADYTLTDTGARPREWQYCVIEMTDVAFTLSDVRNVIVPNNARMWHVFNNTTGPGRILTFKTSAGTGIAIGVGKRAILQCDGTNVVRWTADI